MTTIRLGKDREHHDVLAPIGHLAIFGQTRRAGKTTTLRTLLGQLGRDEKTEYLVFRTGTGEIPFRDAYPSAPHFRARLDWQAVESMLWTFLSEKPKIYRPIIMRSVHGAKSLEDVHRNIVAAGKKSKVGWVVDRTYELDTYFQEILPWLAEHALATTVHLCGEGGNLVDLEGWPKTVQQLVVASTLEALMAGGKRSHPLVVVLPEAREFIPNDRATPVKLAADRLARMGAKLNLFLWIDSQALTGVDQQILRNFALLLQGVQTSDLEIIRICKALDGVKPKMVRELKVGDFLLSTEDGVRTIHIPLVEPKEDPKMDEKERKEYDDRIKKLEDQLVKQALKIRDVMEERDREHARAEANAKAAAANAVERIEAAPRVFGDGGTRPPLARELESEGARTKADLHVFTETPDLTLHVKVVHLEASDEDHTGRLAKLLAEGFFDDKVSTGPIGKEYAARGWENPIAKGGGSGQALRAALRQLCQWGFMREFNGMFGAVPEAKARIRITEEVAA